MAGERLASSPSPEADGGPAPAGGAAHEGGVAAIVVARDHAQRIEATVRAAMALPGVDLVLVVDDGSRDQTQEQARKAGAVVVRHSHRRGRPAALETGASVVAMRDEGGAPRHLLLLEGGMGNLAVAAAPLVPAVAEGLTDLAVALRERGERPTGMAVSLARSAIRRASGWSPVNPLGRVRCLTRAAMEEALPLSRGAGLEVGMTLDVLRAGLSVTEVACDLPPGPRARGAVAPVRGATQYRDVMVAISARGLRGGLNATQDVVDRTLHRRSEEES